MATYAIYCGGEPTGFVQGCLHIRNVKTTQPLIFIVPEQIDAFIEALRMHCGSNGTGKPFKFHSARGMVKKETE